MSLSEEQIIKLVEGKNPKSWTEEQKIDVKEFIITILKECQTKNKAAEFFGVDSIHYIVKFLKIKLEEWSKNCNVIPKSTGQLKRYLLRKGLKKPFCEQCGWDYKKHPWIENMLPGNIPLHLHHKDGNHENINFDNLQLLCPNCHSMTPNYLSKGRRWKRI
jgi:hypothetical protein